MRIVSRFLPFSLALLGCATGAPGTPQADDLDTFVTAQMARRHVPGLSLAIIQDGRIVEARVYGVTDAGGGAAVTPSTLFQAGSISKSVAALGALHLVEQGKLTLDGDVNTTLASWKLPASGFTSATPITLRRLLSHTAGLTVHGFPGYAVDAPRPTLVQVLDGTPPANTEAIRSDAAPGARWNYSGGGYTVMQQMMLDVTGQPFPEYMRQTVLAPIGMSRSSYEQPLPSDMAAATASGHYTGQKPVKGRWHVYPEMAAAGLWTTPTDLARFAIEVQQAFAGRSSRVISPAMTHRMLTEEKDGDGLGVFLQGTGRALLFNHNGRDEGFDASLNAFAETGQGIVVMINANDNSHMMTRITAFVAKKYAWPTAASYVPPLMSAEPVPAARLASYTGRYELMNNNMITLVAANGRLYSASDGLPDEEFIPVSGGRFASADRNVRFAFTHDVAGAITGLTWTQGDRDRAVARVGPLVSMLPREPDPDPAFTARGAHDVSGRALERHGHAVARMAYYTLTTESRQRSLLVYVTRDGLITDFDDVDD